VNIFNIRKNIDESGKPGSCLGKNQINISVIHKTYSTPPVNDRYFSDFKFNKYY
jgi:hypothetical protein